MINGNHFFRTPQDLNVNKSPLSKVLVVGSCLISGLVDVVNNLDNDVTVEYIPYNNLSQLPTQPPSAIDCYDFQVVQLASRSILPDSAFARLGFNDLRGHVDLFEACQNKISIALATAIEYNVKYGLLTFVTNFLTPQINPIGRLQPRSDLRNPQFFYAELNRHLDRQIAEYKNVYVLDVDAISASLGRRFIQDDPVWQINHGSALSDSDFAFDLERIEAPTKASERYHLRIYEFVLAQWYELESMYRTIKRVDAIKLIIIDLDDTLWRGILAEDGVRNIEGWPLGLVEALMFAKKRGIILAIASKNDNETIEKAFPSVYGRRNISLDDFALRRINWDSKVKNVGEIIRDVNVLPESVLFIDDNPVERSSVSSAYPGVRVIGEDPYSTRRILLWASETQVSDITYEAADRSRMIGAQIQRETQRAMMSREDFLKDLDVCVSCQIIQTTGHERFKRVSELINKSNQFNTTGDRMSYEQWLAGFETGLKAFAFTVRDKFTDYGIVAVALLNDNEISQFVMSCRVIGLGVEDTCLCEIENHLLEQGKNEMHGIFRDTGKNLLCSKLFLQNKFNYVSPRWSKYINERAQGPAHVIVC